VHMYVWVRKSESKSGRDGVRKKERQREHICQCPCIDDNNCFYYHSWRNNVVIAFGTLLSIFTQLHIVNGVFCVVCPFAGDEN